MYFIINIINCFVCINALLKINLLSRIKHSKLYCSPHYEKPDWKIITNNLKVKARNWFVNRAEQRGIKWSELSHYYQNKSNSLMYWKVKNTNMFIDYPSYFIQPFHGYENGNMNWQAAYEGEAATLSMSANYWKNITPKTAELWLRKNITKNMDDYKVKHTKDSVFSFETIDFNFSNNTKKFHKHRILDVGCSFGISSEYLQNHYNQSLVTGLDLSPYFLAIAALRNNMSAVTLPNINYVHANAEHMPFENHTYNQVFIQYLFHEMPQKAIKNVIYETYRLLKPGGFLAIVDLEPKNLNEKLSINIFRKWAFEVTEPHIFEYYKTNITELLSNCGFRNIESKKNDPINTIIMAQK